VFVSKKVKPDTVEEEKKQSVTTTATLKGNDVTVNKSADAAEQYDLQKLVIRKGLSPDDRMAITPLHFRVTRYFLLEIDQQKKIQQASPNIKQLLEQYLSKFGTFVYSTDKPDILAVNIHKSTTMSKRQVVWRNIIFVTTARLGGSLKDLQGT